MNESNQSKINLEALPSSLEAHLEYVIQREIEIVQELLSNLKLEQHALINNDKVLLEQIIEERLRLIESFQSWSDVLRKDVVHISETHARQLPKEKEMSHEDYLQVLRDYLKEEDCDLLLLRTKLLFLLQEIYKQHSITSSLIKEKYSPHNMPQLEPLKATEKKVALQVLPLPEDDE